MQEKANNDSYVLDASVDYEAAAMPGVDSDYAIIDMDNDVLRQEDNSTSEQNETGCNAKVCFP